MSAHLREFRNQSIFGPLRQSATTRSEEQLRRMHLATNVSSPRRFRLPLTMQAAHVGAMFCVTEAEAAAIRTAFDGSTKKPTGTLMLALPSKARWQCCWTCHWWCG